MSREMPSPFRPGFSRRPAVLVGRDEILEEADEALAVIAQDHETAMPLLLIGSRGVGKTVLLHEIAAHAGQRYGWPTMALELARPGRFAGQLAASARETIRLLEQTDSTERIRLTDATLRAGGPGLSGELRFSRPPEQPDQPPDPSAMVGDALAALGRVAADRETGVVVTIDELQNADVEHLDLLGAALQQGVREQRPVLLVAAGLPDVRRLGKVPTYFERGDWHEIGLLDADASMRALVEPASQAGRPFNTDAAELLTSQTGGYPYAVQMFGHEAWRASAPATRITRQHAQKAVQRGERKLARGLYGLRWAKASPQEREYLRAVAEHRRDHPSSPPPALRSQGVWGSPHAERHQSARG